MSVTPSHTDREHDASRIGLPGDNYLPGGCSQSALDAHLDGSAYGGTRGVVHNHPCPLEANCAVCGPTVIWRGRERRVVLTPSEYWIATLEDYEPQPSGFGPTPEDAVAMLREALEDRE